MTTLTIPSIPPKPLCGVRHCSIPEHWRTTHAIFGRIKGDKHTIYVDGEVWQP